MKNATLKVNQPVMAYHPSEAAKVAGVSRSAIYLALKSGALKSKKMGTARLILADALQDFLLNLVL